MDNKGICAGKHAIAEYLIRHQGFQLLELANKTHHRLADGPDDELRLKASEIEHDGESSSEFVFENADLLLDFVTKRWQERWVTTDISDGTTLDRFLLRPFFLLVSVDAPMSLRWKRFSDRYAAILGVIGRSILTLSLYSVDVRADNWILQTSRHLSCGMIVISIRRILDVSI